MCGRYVSTRGPDDLIDEYDIDQVLIEEPLPPDYNVAPTKEVYAVMERVGQSSSSTPAQPTGTAELSGPRRQLRAVSWGLVPFWAKDPRIGSRMINARMETLIEKPAFKRAFAKRRCLVPADGYYEWYTPADGPKTRAGKPVKQPFYIRPKDDAGLAMAGLYEIWKDPTRDDDDPHRFKWTVTIITTRAEDAVGHLHDRMPLLVERDRLAEWLDPGPHDAGELLDMLVPAAPGLLEAYPVSRLVNKVDNNGPELIEPLPLEPAQVSPSNPNLEDPIPEDLTPEDPTLGDW